LQIGPHFYSERAYQSLEWIALIVTVIVKWTWNLNAGKWVKAFFPFKSLELNIELPTVYEAWSDYMNVQAGLTGSILEAEINHFLFQQDKGK
jgi:hypothetical protein